ncbi:MAG: NAD-binding protein [Dehalococcoidales bacterium]|nr:NAD-binding protein [Dehalococcoidales bacterium]
MRIVFSGASPLTIVTAKKLIKQGHEVIIIEVDKEKIDQLSDELDGSFLYGDSAKPSVLSQVDPKNSDILFCLTNSDQINIITSLLGRSLGFKRVVTSIEDTDLENLCRELGLLDTIVPVWTLSRHLDNMVRGLDNIELSTLLKEDARFFTFRAGEEDAVGIDDLGLPRGARVIFYYRDNKFQFVDNDTKFRKGDEIVILTNSSNIPGFNERWYPKRPIKDNNAGGKDPRKK